VTWGRAAVFAGHGGTVARSTYFQNQRYHEIEEAAVMKYLFRAAFLALFLFELANALGILHIDLSYTWLGLMVTLLIVFLVMEAVHRSFQHQGHPGLHWNVWLLGFSSIFIDALGDVFDWYHQFSWYDQAAHLTSSAFLCLVVFQIIHVYAKARSLSYSNHLKILLASLGSVTAGVVYEIEEYLEDWFTGSSRS
jgi:hypothetical protein